MAANMLASFSICKLIPHCLCTFMEMVGITTYCTKTALQEKSMFIDPIKRNQKAFKHFNLAMCLIKVSQQIPPFMCGLIQVWIVDSCLIIFLTQCNRQKLVFDNIYNETYLGMALKAITNIKVHFAFFNVSTKY